MVECSQCLPEEMREGGNHGEMRQRRTGPESPLSPSLQLWSLLMGSTKRREAVFRTCKWSGTFSVMTSFQGRKKIKNLPSTWRCCTSLFLLAILHQLSNSTCPVWDAVTRLAAFMLETRILELVFPKLVWPNRDWGGRHLSAAESAKRTVALFSRTWQKLL